MQEHNAKITYTTLGFQDHGIFTFIIGLSWAGASQASGMYKIGPKYEYCSELIIDILNTIGVKSWEEINGQLVRIKHDDSQVYAIGNIVENKWLNFKEWFAEHQPKRSN